MADLSHLNIFSGLFSEAHIVFQAVLIQVLHQAVILGISDLFKADAAGQARELPRGIGNKGAIQCGLIVIRSEVENVQLNDLLVAFRAVIIFDQFRILDDDLAILSGADLYFLDAEVFLAVQVEPGMRIPGILALLLIDQDFVLKGSAVGFVEDGSFPEAGYILALSGKGTT